MGICTMLIGALPGHASAGVMAPVLLCILRLGQGIGLGGEWGGAVLLATEKAPRHQRAWFGMFPQFGPSLCFLMSNDLFLLLFLLLTNEQFAAWGWRMPFLASTILVAVGLYVRGRLTETPTFARLAARCGQVRVPLGVLLRHHSLRLVLGSLTMVVCYAIFYTTTVFALDYGTRVNHIPRSAFLGLLSIAITMMAIVTPASAFLSDRFGCRPVLLVGLVLAAISGSAMRPLLGTGSAADALVYLCLELGLVGLLFAPMGALLPSLFPPHVR
jgi:MFS family permease